MKQYLLIILCCWLHPLQADQIDIGIFESGGQSKIEIRLRPDFTIQGNQTITAIRYTMKWVDPDINISLDYIAPYFVAAIDQPVFYNDHYYQIYLAVPQDSVATAIEAGQERIVSSFSWSGNDCVFFEIVEDEWTQNNNGNIMLELQGNNKTGIIYEAIADMRSVGGLVSGGGVISPGEETGILQLEDFSGDVLHWQRNHNNEWQYIDGSEGQTSHSETPASHGHWLYRAVVQRNNCDPAYSTPASVVVVEQTSWTGQSGADWFNTDNWTAGQPQAHYSANIPGNTQNHPVIDDGFAHCFDLVIHEGADLTIAENGSLSVDQSLVNQGSLIIRSSSLGTGSLIHNSPGVEATVEYHIEASANWPEIGENNYLLSSPVENQAIDDFLADINSDGFALYAWQEKQNAWISYNHENWNELNNGPLLNPAQAYLLALNDSRTLAFQGVLNIDSMPKQELGRTIVDGDERNAGWHLLGNPYTSTIRWDQHDWQLNKLCGIAQIWDREAQSYKPVSDGMLIPAMQGFFVQVDRGISGSLLIPSGNRVHENHHENDQQQLERIVLKAVDPEGGSMQRSIIQLHPEASMQYDTGLDARFIPGYAPHFYTIIGDEKLLVYHIPQLTDNLTIPLVFKKNNSENFYIALHESIAGIELFLHDHKTNTEHPLSLDASYHFIAEEDDDPLRFELRFEAGTTHVIDTFTENDGIRVWSHKNSLIVENRLNKVSIHVFDTQGRLVKAYKPVIGRQSYVTGLPPSVYSVVIINENEITMVKKLVIN